jgi:hypothetical protein|tara:strand:- start:5504 stop:7441 length:1938 start_codon:yes stop_codon:yes gene_type:complete
MPFTKFTNLDFDQIKTSIKDYIRANSDFTDFDFEGSNFSVLIDTLAYNTYITAFNSNMIVNESFLDSATVRENVVALARNIGYVPRSRTASQATISFDVTTSANTPTLTLQAGLVCVGSSNDTSFVFSIPESITTTTTQTTDANGNIVSSTGSFSDIIIYQGTYLSKTFTVDGSLDQRFILENSFIDTSTIKVFVKGSSDTGLGREYRKVDNILNITDISETYLIQETTDERYELLFGDGVFGKKLENEATISVSYIVTDGVEGNGPAAFNYAGSVTSSSNQIALPSTTPIVTTVSSAANGGSIESIDSIKYFAPRLYSSQYRAVTARDYEAIIQQIYPNTESVSVVGGEELDPPEFGTVFITIKPKNGEFVSDFDKNAILSNLKSYSLAGINQKLLDLKLLYVELDSFVYYDQSKVTTVSELKTNIINGLLTYGSSTDLNKFGGRFKYSKIVNVIDNIDEAITSNITRVRIRRNLRALTNQFAQYELCYGNRFYINPEGKNIKSTGFTIQGQTDMLYFTDIPNRNSDGTLDGSGKGVIAIVKGDTELSRGQLVVTSAGIVDYVHGEVIISTVNITSTQRSNNIIEIQAFPESNDIIGLKDLYLSFAVGDSAINMVKDTISSGEQISGVGYKVTSSYANGALVRG